MKYKVGDKVKIREDLKVEHLYGGSAWVTQGMHNLGGKIATIVGVNKRRGVYCIDLDNSSYLWTSEMFEDVNHIDIDVDGNKVIASRGNKKGIASCHPDDEFDFYIGAKIALERLEEAEKPYGWLTKGMPYYIPDFATNKLYVKFPYAADHLDRMHMERGIVFQTKEEAIECAKRMLTAVKQED